MLGSRAASGSNSPRDLPQPQRPARLGRQHQQDEVDRAEQQHRIRHIMLEQRGSSLRASVRRGKCKRLRHGRSVGEIDKFPVKTLCETSFSPPLPPGRGDLGARPLLPAYQPASRCRPGGPRRFRRRRRPRAAARSGAIRREKPTTTAGGRIGAERRQRGERAGRRRWRGGASWG